mmetsp:Transcript_12683/g.12789  ORF Transcript_12683/g.12789 Transcript_12683/m.12789 type:complete len:280 (-) Transcript_12683:38-877(-)|eukprot:CAMPEP_0202941092 /NCGR_PEP_ID=MMETSP1395-20130829/1198_1 /ASSEMBLY_ACC=CAM_ASM_000871 /TAXON_ID=5961 /ORGANISM="Blepharisma japonicum, Strain Stock R1072" /LENGTH=279 /DNA_ID=CAMNT_0049635987 /DNA_START=168 /DNA_END=1007 /DNA_ORIENTATION=+
MGLAELGLHPGDKVVTWLTCKEYPESLILHLACAKAGFEVISLDSTENFESSMKSAKLLILSPWESLEGNYRIDYLLNHIPEMSKTNAGSVLKSNKFPELKGVIQTGFSTIRGSLKMKQVPVYAQLEETTNPMNSFEVKANTPSFTHYGSSHTQEELVSFATDFAKKIGIKGGDTVVNTLVHKYPLTFGSALGASFVGAKTVFAPEEDGLSVYNAQHAKVLIVCPGKAQNIKAKGEIETLVIGTKKKENIELVVKTLHNKGVKAKNVVDVDLLTLKKSP